MSTYVPIQAITLSASASSIDFTNIPQTFTDLVLVGRYSFASNGIRFATVRVGNNTIDTGSNYSDTYLDTYTGSPNTGRNTNVTQALFSYSSSGGLTTSQSQVAIANFMNYSNTTTNKTIINRNMSAADMVSAYVNLWRNTSAINYIRIIAGNADFASGSTFTLYGIGSGSPKAFGGDVVTTDGTYWYHIYNSSGRFEPVQTLTCDYLVIAGGGGGGSGRGGGGGAGGYRTTVGTSGGGGSAESALSLSANTAYTVTIGGGGAGGVNDGNGVSGSNSVFSTITSTGGGAGGGYQKNGINGGSGGGAAGVGGGASTTPGTGTTNQGFGGGQDSTSGGGGGGGAGAVGGNAGANGGTGGTSLSSSISGSSVARAGGGGGGNSGGSGGTGGGGGAGNGSSTNTGGSATANTGSGGGGCDGNPSTAGNGGSGIIILRYAV